MQNHKTSACWSSFAIDRYLLGLISKEEVQRFKTHLEACDRCRHQIELKEAHISQYRSEGVEKKILGRLKEVREQPSLQDLFIALLKSIVRLEVLIPVGSVAMIIGFVFVFQMRFLEKGRNDNLNVDLIKGAPAIDYVVVREGKPMDRESIALYRAGDRLQFYYSSPKNMFLMVFSVDEVMTVFWYYPSGKGESIPIHKGNRVGLKWSIELDKSVLSERVFAIFSDTPFEPEAVLAWIETAKRSKLSLGQLKFRDTVEVQSFWLRRHN